MSRLRDRGPVAISPSNPFLAGNLFLSREKERSSELRGFIEHRGTPDSLEIHQSFFSPVTVLLHYTSPKETYQLIASDDSWIIDGPIITTDTDTPSPISSTHTAEHSSRTPHSGASATAHHSEGFESPAPTSLAGQSAQADSLSHSDTHPPRIAPPPPQSPRAKAAPKSPLSAHGTESSELQMLHALVAASPAAEAEMSPHGDLVHYVTFPNETLTVLARWYTFDRFNAGRLGRMNQLSEERGILHIGDVVVIPSYMVRNKRRLSAEALSSLGAQ